jgi:hypothetical protein
VSQFPTQAALDPLLHFRQSVNCADEVKDQAVPNYLGKLVLADQWLIVLIEYDQYQVGGTQIHSDVQPSVWFQIQRRLIRWFVQWIIHPVDDLLGAFEDLE